ncbi:hypothetical protein DPMN_112023 [Dreissena polymorpha]|uniref:Uncharacterized protein n=1 Tax=Dreissena polymorpha TaxID=45954 RepID=A0A9D4KFM9_DREPO|nr:hypothetical protein DPMN_112023 [Dreissena polymorpha]
MNGTFKVVIQPFYQLQSIHAFVKKGEDEKQGDPIVEWFIEKRRIYRKIKGLVTAYQQQGDKYQFFRKIMSLPYLPVEQNQRSECKSNVKIESKRQERDEKKSDDAMDCTEEFHASELGRQKLLTGRSKGSNCFPENMSLVGGHYTGQFAHLRGCLQTKFGRTDGGQRPILKPHLSNQKTAPAPGSHETNVLTKFHENWAKKVTSRVEKCPAHWRPCFSPITTIFEHVRDINKTNVLSNFHDDWAKIVTSSPNKENCPPTGGHVFHRTKTTFELNQHIIKTNILTIFQLHRDFIGTNLLTKFHKDRTKNVASRVFTRKTAPPTGGHVFQQTKPLLNSTNISLTF